jgi:hypothetical protein
VSGSTPDGNGVNFSVSYGEIQIDTERFKVVSLLLAQQFPLQRAELRHGHFGNYDGARWRIDNEKPG